MPRIPDQELDRLKREIPVADLARAKGVKLERHGNNLIGLCPFHDDKDPSLVITPAKNLWLCGAPHNQSYTESIVTQS